MRPASTWVEGVTNRMISDSSRMAVMKVNNIPAMMPLVDSGTMILDMRLNQPIPCARAASSRDLSIWCMAAMPVREVKGRFLTTVIRIKRKKVPYSAGIGP